MNTPNHESTDVEPVSEMHARLLAFRKQVVAEYQRVTDAFDAKLADLDAAIAAVIVRQPTPAAPPVERQQCKECGGWLVERGGFLVHDRDGQIACKPGHSGPVATPLTQTTAFPTVQPGDATQVIPAVTPHDVNLGELSALTGRRVKVHYTDGTELVGKLAGFDGADPSGNPVILCITHADGYPPTEIFRPIMDNVAYVEPADLDTPTAAPAQDGSRADG